MVDYLREIGASKRAKFIEITDENESMKIDNEIEREFEDNGEIFKIERNLYKYSDVENINYIKLS